MPKMTVEEIIQECSAAGVTLRINPTDRALTAIPRKKLSDRLLAEIVQQRSEVMEFLEQLEREEGEFIIEPVVVPDPEPPSVAEQIVTMAAARGITIALDVPNAAGRVRITTPVDENLGIPKSIDAVMPGLGSKISSHMGEITKYLRAPYMPALPAQGSEEAKKRNWAERIAVPDDLLPSQVENQQLVRDLITGQGPSAADIRRNELAEAIVPQVIHQRV